MICVEKNPNSKNGRMRNCIFSFFFQPQRHGQVRFLGTNCSFGGSAPLAKGEAKRYLHIDQLLSLPESVTTDV